MVVFRDNRWNGDQSIFATMEIDLTHGSQLVYAIPNTMMTIGDFCRNIQISVLTRGYNNWQNGEANLLITRGLVGRLSNTSNVGFVYSIQGVRDFLTSHGVRALQGQAYNTSEIQGRNWIIKPPVNILVPMQPQSMESRNLLGGAISLRFSNYKAAPEPSHVNYNNEDEEVDPDEEQIVAILHQNDHNPMDPFCPCNSCNYEAAQAEKKQDYSKPSEGSKPKKEETRLEYSWSSLWKI